MYRVGWPCWKVLGRLGLPLVVRVEVRHDTEANVYWASSPDLDGLVVEAKTLDELRLEVRLAGEMLMELELNGHHVKTTPELKFRDAAFAA